MSEKIRKDDDNEKKEFDVAIAGTADTFTGTQTEGTSSVIINKPVINVQLKEWIDAKELYDDKVRDVSTPNPSQMRSIIISLADSLYNLFGMNYSPKSEGKIPPVTTLANSGEFKLKKNRPDLYRDLVSLDELYGKLKHPDSQRIQSVMGLLTKELVKKYMKIIKKIWIWALDVIHRGDVSADQLIEFENFDV